MIIYQDIGGKIVFFNDQHEKHVDTQTIELDNEQIPKHIAIIMDGNGRWAKKQNTTSFGSSAWHGSC
jgi:undecaprenyl pyrophosphate synthase